MIVVYTGQIKMVKFFNRFEGISGVLQTMVQRKGMFGHTSYSKLSEGSPKHLAGMMADPNRMLIS